MSEVNFHYAYQLCDIASREGKPRICGDDRTLLSMKSVKSFITSCEALVKEKPETKHTICFFNDRSTDQLVSFVKELIDKHKSDNISFEFQNTVEPGIDFSIKVCYMWLQTNGKDLVYQVQDDYVFYPSALTEMYEVFDQIKKEVNYDIIVSPFNDFWLWLAVYRNSCTPRTVIVGKNRYWIQYYDMSCSFMTSHEQFSKHWDLYHMFFELLDKKDPNLERYSLNYMLTQRGVLGLIPVNSIAYHMQTELEQDPHKDWRELWDSVDVTSTTT
ncbi:hypothetical protein EB118_03720 [bacterium]|nr:hypothetical protein [bacterium]